MAIFPIASWSVLDSILESIVFAQLHGLLETLKWSSVSSLSEQFAYKVYRIWTKQFGTSSSFILLSLNFLQN